MQYEVKYFSGEKVVHANGVFQPGDVALCGADLMGDSHLGWVAGVETNKKINCSACIQIIKACKNIPATSIGVPKLIEYR